MRATVGSRSGVFPSSTERGKRGGLCVLVKRESLSVGIVAVMIKEIRAPCTQASKHVEHFCRSTKPLHRVLFACSLHMYRSIVYLAIGSRVRTYTPKGHCGSSWIRVKGRLLRAALASRVAVSAARSVPRRPHRSSVQIALSRIGRARSSCIP